MLEEENEVDKGGAGIIVTSRWGEDKEIELVEVK
jgi:hypothetical protein